MKLCLLLSGQNRMHSWELEITIMNLPLNLSSGAVTISF